MHRRDFWGLGVAVLVTAGLITYRAVYLEPREWGALCAAARAPLACVPRAALGWLQYHYALGTAALALGLWGFAWRGGFAVQLAAVLVGAAAIENYNASWGAVGLALGAWGWLRRDGWRRGTAAL